MTDQTLATEQINEIETRMKSFVEAIGLEVEISDGEIVDEETLYFNFSGQDQDVFLENKGENLRGLATLMQTSLDHHHPDNGVKIKLDAGGSVRAKEDELRTMAIEVADSLAEVGEERLLEPMNSYDRRIVHLSLRDRDNLETESVGEGHVKRMIVRKIK